MSAAGNKSFSVTETKIEGGSLFNIEGAVNSAVNHELREALLAAADKGHVLLNMSQVTLLTSTGVGTLFEVSEIMQGTSNQLWLIDASKPVKSVIDLTGLSVLFKFADTEDEAMSELTK